MAIKESAIGNDSVAVMGTASQGERTVGVLGQGDSVGVKGVGKGWHGVEGISTSTIGGFGVYGANTAGGTGVVGESTAWMGVYGKSESTSGGHGVFGEGVGTGVAGVGKTWLGVYGETRAPASAGAAGVLGEGKEGGDGVKGHASGQGKAAVAGFHLTNKGPGIFGRGAPAGLFEGDVNITGRLIVAGRDIVASLQSVAATQQQVTSSQQQVTNLQQQVTDLQQMVVALQSQLNSVASNLQGRITQAEIAISSLNFLAHSHQ